MKAGVRKSPKLSLAINLRFYIKWLGNGKISIINTVLNPPDPVYIVSFEILFTSYFPRV